MLRVGLTGGIGSGKSEVARRLAALGALVIDADRLARDVVEPGTEGFAAVVEGFGDEVVGLDGRLDRAALAARVFGDPEQLARLNRIVHPLVAARAAELVAAVPPDSVVVHDVPLLVENGLEADYDVVVVVDAPDDLRLRRVVARGLTEADARARMAAQASREARLAAADIVVENDGDLAALDTRVAELWARLEAAAG
ncbi:MAG TPA: dephospho-CoA kinase [Actinomycetes bacterium]|nr:dephospho-CoA kinase [Actinomycetes bacterium]